MKINLNKSVATRVIAYLVGAVTLVLVLVSVFVYHSYRQLSLSELKNDMSITGDQLATGTALALWNVEQAQVLGIMNSFMRDPVVYRIVIDSGIKKLILKRDADWNVHETETEDSNFKDVLSDKRDIVFSGTKIGTVEVDISTRFLQEKLNRLSVLLLLGIVLVDVILISILYYVLWRSVLYPLKLIEAYAVSVSHGKRDDALVNKSPMKGEFVELRNTLQSMLGKLDAQLIEIKESSDRFWNMVRNFPLPLVIYEPSTGEISYTNQQFTTVFGYLRTEVPNAESWFVQAYPDATYRQQVIATWREELDLATRENTLVKSHVYRVVCKNGMVRHVDISGVPSGDFMLVIFNDVTERLAAETELQKYQASLEGLVSQRTRELQVARDVAEKASRSKSVFLSNMSHELRTPLNAILGFANLLSYDQNLGEDSRKKLATINRAGQHLLSLINDVLEISRIEAGKAVLKVDPFIMSELLSGVQEMVNERAAAKGLKFELESLVDAAQAVNGDEHHLKQVLINLLGNAVKYTDQGSVMLKVSSNGEVVSFEISDTGHGISEVDQQNLFKPFFQTEYGIAKGEGTGLGLAISQEYTKMMGGQLQVRSQPGEGSVFTLTLPLPATAAPVLKQDLGRVLGLLPGQPEVRVLVVDDKEDNRELVKQYLEFAGFRVQTANDGKQAVESFIQWQPHFIWMDMRMPVMDGYESTQQIRKLPGGDTVKIVALTASAFEEDRARIISAGCNDMVRKPLEESRIFEVMEQLLGVRYQYEASVAPAHTEIAKLDLSVLPPELLQKLAKVARELNLNAVRLIVKQLEESHPEIAMRLGVMVQGFRLDQIAAMCVDVD